MWRKHTLGWIILAILLGALIGSVFGQILGLILPDGVVKDFFLRSVDFGFGPLDIDFVMISLTLGLYIKFNITGVLGIVLAAYILRWYA
ncbi:DUF4321 domain-containing protein [candidate division KSB1 bacterium]|nr:DUF4321 domain-containing protein [candidate division KSB1 bacterium]